MNAYAKLLIAGVLSGTALAHPLAFGQHDLSVSPDIVGVAERRVDLPVSWPRCVDVDDPVTNTFFAAQVVESDGIVLIDTVACVQPAVASPST